MPLSALAGGVAGGPLLETLGRKRAILHTAVPFILASLAVAYAGDVTTVYVISGLKKMQDKISVPTGTPAVR